MLSDIDIKKALEDKTIEVSPLLKVTSNPQVLT